MRVPGTQCARCAARQRGYTLIELLVVVLIIGLVAAVAIPVYQSAIGKSRRSALIADSKELHTAFMRYYVDRGSFPPESGAAGVALDRQTLSPLTGAGYYRGATSFLHKLLNDRVLVYQAPDIGSPNSEFFAIVRSKNDPTQLVWIAHTSSLFGVSLDGVYLLVGGHFARADGST